MSSAEAHPWSQNGDVWAYALVPPLFLFLGTGYAVGPLNISLHGLWIPVAAWLGARHGKRGLHVVLIAGVPLLLGVGFMGLYTEAAIGSYIAAILACRLSGQPLYREESIEANKVTLRMLAFLFLAVALDFGVANRFGSFDLMVWTGFAPYFWMMLIFIGVSDARLRRLLAWLFAAAAFGFLVPYLGAQSPRLAGFGVNYWINGPQAIFTASAALLVGRLLRRRFRASAENRYPVADSTGRAHVLVGSPIERFTPLFLLLAFSLAGSMMSLDIPSFLPRPAGGFVTLSTSTATALLLFACGLVGGLRGALLATALWSAASIALPFLIAPHEMATVAFGPLVITSPHAYVQTTYLIAPRMSLAFLDPVFALFGWLVAKRLATREEESYEPMSRLVDRDGATRPSIPPPFRFRRMDIVWATAGAIWMMGTIAYAVSRS